MNLSLIAFYIRINSICGRINDSIYKKIQKTDYDKRALQNSHPTSCFLIIICLFVKQPISELLPQNPQAFQILVSDFEKPLTFFDHPSLKMPSPGFELSH